MEELKSKRKTVKASISRIYNYCMQNEAPIEGILARMEKLDQYYQQFENIQNEIDNKVDSPEEISVEEAYRAQIDNVYFQLKALSKRSSSNISSSERMLNNGDQQNQQIVSIIDNIAANQTTLGNLIQTITTHPPVTSTPVIQQGTVNSVQLPRINLPQFNGSNTMWIHFRDLFEAIIHNNNNLSNIEKFEYLQSHIKGDALSLVKHLNLSNDNYSVAWNLIKTKYNDSQQLKREYLQLLFDQPSMRGATIADANRLLNNTNICNILQKKNNKRKITTKTTFKETTMVGTWLDCLLKHQIPHLATPNVKQENFCQIWNLDSTNISSFMQNTNISCKNI